MESRIKCKKCGEYKNVEHGGFCHELAPDFCDDCKKAMMELTSEEKLAAIELWQRNPMLHPMMCGNGVHKHENLIGLFENGEVKLQCLDCDYVQKYVPKCVYEFYAEHRMHGEELKNPKEWAEYFGCFVPEDIILYYDEKMTADEYLRRIAEAHERPMEDLP